MFLKIHKKINLLLIRFLRYTLLKNKKDLKKQLNEYNKYHWKNI